jgi:hypothetical protein
VDTVQGFGRVLLQHAASLLAWVFGLPQALEQLPQRAVHGALAIRQMIVEARASDLTLCPEVRLAVHLGAVRVATQTQDPTVQMLAVGDTLALPVRLLRQVGGDRGFAGGGRLVEGSVALEVRALQRRVGDPARVGGYIVVGVPTLKAITYQVVSIPASCHLPRAAVVHRPVGYNR